MAHLILLLDGQATTIELSSDEAILGRDPKCTLEIKSGMVSRKHARVYKNADEFLVEDMGSGNGTFVNGSKIEGPKSIKHGDRIKLGPVLLRFEKSLGGEVRPAPPSRPAPSKLTSSRNEIGETFNVEVDDDDDESTMMTGRATGFGNLEVKPEAKLKGVLEISKALAGTANIDSLLPKILDTLFNIFPHADRGCVLLKDEITSKMIPRAMKHRRAGDDETVKLSRTILKKVL